MTRQIQAGKGKERQMAQDKFMDELNEYVAMVQERVNAYWEERGFQKHLGDPPTMTIEMGRKNAKIVSVSNLSLPLYQQIKSVHTFVNMETGDILKAGSWKAPAPNGVRGNIFTEDHGASVVNEHGAKYLN